MAQALRSAVHLFDYLELEEASPTRHEYVAGEVHAMVGGTFRHNQIALNVAVELRQHFAGTPCKVFVNDVKLHVQSADCVYYPDLLVVCGTEVAGGQKMAQDALLIVEVTSDSTEAIDRREKLAAYRKLAGLRAYWIVSHESRRVDVHQRDATGQWQARALTADDALEIPAAGDPALALATVYAGTDLA